jgi:hypothetical protein
MAPISVTTAGRPLPDLEDEELRSLHQALTALATAQNATVSSLPPTNVEALMTLLSPYITDLHWPFLQEVRTRVCV